MAARYDFHSERKAWDRAINRITLRNAQWLAIVGLVTNLATGRFKLVDTSGDEVAMTEDEIEAVSALRRGWERLSGA